jgi:hypothetical protein
MAYREDVCERSTMFYDYVDKDRMTNYCNRKDRIKDTVVATYKRGSHRESFYAEKWIDVCSDNNKPCDLYNNMDPERQCYPTRKLDKYTGRLANSLSDDELEIICGKPIIRSISIPQNVKLNIELAQELLKKGYKRTKYGYKEDFTIPYTNISSQTLYLWLLWMENNGPKNIRKNNNYYLNYTKWLKSDFSDKSSFSGAIEWLLKGGDHAYFWLQSSVVQKRINNKYRPL